MLAPATAPLRVRVDETLARFLDGQRAEWSDPDQSLVYEAVRDFVLTGGKRIRPAFCYWGWRGAAGVEPDDQPVVQVGAALELFHCFALIHDDIMDASARRRGRPSMHESFAQLHRARAWRGDPAEFGRHTALLCGDLCASWSDQLFVECGAAPDRVAAAHDLFSRTRSEAIAGQFLELVGQVTNPMSTAGGRDRAIERALRVAKLKTARYTVSRPLQIGATLAGAGPELLASYAVFGELLGEVYQLRDDVLGVFGDPLDTGKSDVDDIRDAKPTVLLAMTFDRADAAQLATLRTLVGRSDLHPDGAAVVRGIMTATGALDAVEELIEQGAQAAQQALTVIALPDDARAALSTLTRSATRRSH